MAARLFAKFITYTAIIGLILAIAGEVPSVFTNTSELIRIREVANNAAVKQHAEAVAMEEQRRNELEVARNSALRMKGEAEQAMADADRLEAEATTAQQMALNARQKAKADADVIVAQAELNRQKAASELQAARVAAQQKRTEADQAEQDLKQNRYILRENVYLGGLINCPGNTYIAKINAADEGRCP